MSIQTTIERRILELNREASYLEDLLTHPELEKPLETYLADAYRHGVTPPSKPRVTKAPVLRPKSVSVSVPVAVPVAVSQGDETPVQPKPNGPSNGKKSKAKKS